ncbi:MULTISPECIES: hypothetical protein [unclassified Sphingomonas]|uniref:hypothetical protein n=1 Tax=unclassified Sphingomonas TaxID=196159 RepID=UPI0021513FDA|nr:MULTISPECIES: hypothetical protein [unclassified Sphingomonas]MCR5870343.1 hypothetical protein [Sphingomonas sp. J344]UUX97973.1 hypothetical protein LRS08_09975 [Sphingomonas sp. J315]
MADAVDLAQAGGGVVDFHEWLTPFVSLTLAKAAGVAVADQLERCLADIEAICAAEEHPATSDFTRLRARAAAGVRLQSMWYKRTLKPAWTDDASFIDVQHHLVIALVRKGHLALHISDPKVKGPLRAALIGELDPGAPLTWLSPIPRAIMSAAFLQNGQARTLWLSGVHRRSATKADAKILAGQDLDYSLDPFDDQSFYWSAARSRNAALEITVGVSPKASRVWLGKAKSIDGFAASTALLIDAVAAAKQGSDEPFRFLATPMEMLDPAKVTGGYDLSILPPDMLEDGDEDADAVNADAALVIATNLIAEPANGSNLSVSVEINSETIGTLTLEVAIARDGKVKFKATDPKPAGVNDEAFNRIKALLGRGVGVNVRYDSGHSVSDRQIYALRMPRIAFSQYEATDFKGYLVKQEKPKDLTKIGAEKSLFCWVQNTHKGWLACDDGANEKADFIHLDISGAKPVLSLIHVKGANSDKASRRLSVAAYEVVTGQAIKNLQWLDKQALARGLSQAVRATNYWWKDGKPVAKDELVAAIESLGDEYVRRVIIVQPHVTETARTKAEAAKDGVNRLRLDQLNTLLASAWRSCNGLGAEFKVIWAK